tara:strand:+ start:221 stop:424 length:204 start_codon:yes stop_codon:yes gene_type:complete
MYNYIERNKQRTKFMFKIFNDTHSFTTESRKIVDQVWDISVKRGMNVCEMGRRNGQWVEVREQLAAA